MKRSLIAAAALALLATGTTSAAVPARTLAAGPRSLDGLSLPGQIGAPSKVLQMITVVSPGWHSTTGTLKAWERPPDGRWHKVRGPLPVVLGYSGWVVADQRIQSTGTTPAGRFRLPAAFGLAADPGTALRYTVVDGNDWWPYEPRDPATYNIYQFHRDQSSHWRADFSEHLADYPTQYDYAVVVGFNLPSGVHYSPSRHQRVADEPADTRRGGGIFLHVRGTGSTAGCVAMARVQMQWLLRWLDPDKHPQVVMGPYHYVLRL